MTIRNSQPTFTAESESSDIGMVPRHNVHVPASQDLRLPIRTDYRASVWVGTLTLQSSCPGPGEGCSVSVSPCSG